MSLRTMAVGAFILALPVAVEVPTSPDSGSGRGGETRITVVGGVGRYALVDRGCEGQVLRTYPVRFREAGGSIEHRFSNDLAVGLRGGAAHEKVEYHRVATDSVEVVVSERDIAYLNPFVGLEARHVGFGVGWISGDDGFRLEVDGTERPRIPSTHLRIGSLEKTYVKLGLMEGVPLYTGGGYAEIGVGAHPHRLWNVYAGLNGGPFDRGGLGLRLDYRVLPHWAIAGRARLGESGGERQNGVGVGLTYTSLPPSPQRGEER